MRKVILLLTMLILLFPVFADYNGTEVDLTKGDYSFISDAFGGKSMAGLFKQTKTVAGSPRSFVSTGSILIKTGMGIVWCTQKPYPSILVVGRDVLIQKIRDGEATHLDIANNPIYIQIATSLECVFSADFSKIASLFTTYLTTDADGWELLLIPRDKTVASFMTSITMTGSSSFDSLKMVETTGDSILYEFSDMEQRELTDEELALYSL